MSPLSVVMFAPSRSAEVGFDVARAYYALYKSRMAISFFMGVNLGHQSLGMVGAEKAFFEI